jgi:hypothetical protein
MPVYAIVFGLLLTALGVTAYVSPDTLAGGKPHQLTALTPAFVGVPILLSGVVVLISPRMRKHAMHGAAVLGLLGTFGGLVPVFLRKFDFTQTAVIVGSGMTVLSLVFVVLCVKSFVDARKARKANEAAGTA